MPMVEVLVAETIDESASGIVTEGTAPDKEHGAREAAQKVVRRVIDLSAEKIVSGVVEIANKIGPTLKNDLGQLAGISVSEVSIGCAIGADGRIVVAGVAAQASLTITFKIS